MVINGILQDFPCLLCVDKTTHGSNSTIIGELNEYRTKSGDFWVLRGWCEVDMTELIRVVDFLIGVVVGLFLCVIVYHFKKQ